MRFPPLARLPHSELAPIVTRAAGVSGVSPDTVLAMVHIESAGNPWAMRFEPAWRWFHRDRHGAIASVSGVSSATEQMQQATSWGLLQVMGAVARDMGYRDPFLSGLCEPAVGLFFGCQYLRRMLRHFDNEESAAIVSYNAGYAGVRGRNEFSDIGRAYLRKVLEMRSRLEREYGSLDTRREA